VNYEIDNIACDFGSRMTISNCCRWFCVLK